MPEGRLTAEQVLDISKTIQSVANEISDYTIDHFHELTEKERKRLNTVEANIRSGARELLESAEQILWEDLQPAIREIGKATAEMRKAHNRINSFKRAISIAAGVITIAGAILTQNPIAIANATAEFLDLFRQFEKEDEDAKKNEDDAVG